MTKYESSKLYMSEDGVETSIICVKYSSKTKKVYDVVYTVLLPSGGTTVTEYNNMLERLTAKYGKSNDLSRMKHYKKASQVMDKSMMSGAYWVDKHNKLCLEILAYSDISTITDNAGWAGKIMNLFMSDNGAIAVHYLNPEVDNEIEKEKIDNL